ncbi:hypothetical protein ACGF5S_31580 [Nocardia nova]|uniref:hypothetical protein n=1 Tax=Nocardia nova TaxID=37330 RepID=UPI0037181E6D
MTPLGMLPLAAVLVARLRPYYLGDGFALFFATPAVRLVGDGPYGRVGKALAAYCAAGMAVVVAAVCVLPLPQSWLHGSAIRNGDMAIRAQFFGLRGWPQLADTVAHAVDAAPEAERAQVVIVTQNYWQASVLAVLGSTDLPPVYSVSRGYGYFGPPPDSATRVLYVGGVDLERELPARFTTVAPVARLDDPNGFQGVDYGIRVSLCWARFVPGRRSGPN